MQNSGTSESNNVLQLTMTFLKKKQQPMSKNLIFIKDFWFVEDNYSASRLFQREAAYSSSKFCDPKPMMTSKV